MNNGNEVNKEEILVYLGSNEGITKLVSSQELIRRFDLNLVLENMNESEQLQLFKKLLNFKSGVELLKLYPDCINRFNLQTTITSGNFAGITFLWALVQKGGLDILAQFPYYAQGCDLLAAPSNNKDHTVLKKILESQIGLEILSKMILHGIILSNELILKLLNLKNETLNRVIIILNNFTLIDQESVKKLFKTKMNFFSQIGILLYLLSKSPISHIMDNKFKNELISECFFQLHPDLNFMRISIETILPKFHKYILAHFLSTMIIMQSFFNNQLNSDNNFLTFSKYTSIFENMMAEKNINLDNFNASFISPSNRNNACSSLRSVSPDCLNTVSESIGQYLFKPSDLIPNTVKNEKKRQKTEMDNSIYENA